MDKTRMIHKNDEITRRFYQVDKLLLENPKYKNLSDGAILAWSILRDRMELSRQNSEVYSDEEGYLFLIFTDEELAEILHRTRKTANNRKKELERFGLLYNVRMGNQKANRLYLLEPEKCDPNEYISDQYRKKKKDKQLEKAKTQKKKYIMIELPKERRQNYPQDKTLGRVMKSKKGTSVMSKNYSSGRVKKVHPDEKKLLTNDTKVFNTNLKKTNIFEEEVILPKEIEKINIHFANLIREVLGLDNIYDDDMIARIILEMKHHQISFLTRQEMLDQHRKMIKKRDNEQEIWDWAKYFVGGIIKNRLSEPAAIYQDRLTKVKQFNESVRKNKQNVKVDFPFFDWLKD